MWSDRHAVGQRRRRSGSIARAATAPRTDSEYTAKVSSARPSRSSLSNAAGIPSSSCTAAPDAQPATSYNGEGEHNGERSAPRRPPRPTAPSVDCAAVQRSTTPTRSNAPMKCAAKQHRPDLPARPGHRRVKPREGSRQRLQLPGLLQRLLPTQVCHNTVPHPAVLVAIPIHELQVRIRALSALDLGFLDEHVATTLPASPDRKTGNRNTKLPQQTPPKTGTDHPHPQAHSHSQPLLPIHRRGKRG